MQSLAELYFAHPAWFWLALAALVLAVEVATGTGWLLWPSASAAVTSGVAALNLPFGLAGDIVVFAVLTIVSTLMARRFLPLSSDKGAPDVNDQTARLLGQSGIVVDGFVGGQGRVLVGGAEWPARSAGHEDLSKGARVTVESLDDGARLTVRAV